MIKKQSKCPYQTKTLKLTVFLKFNTEKPYIAVNDNFYIQLHIQELQMCKTIRHVYYCEELFLIKHRTHPTCESAIFYKAPPMTVYSVCTFKYFYNVTVQPSILDGGNHIPVGQPKGIEESYMFPQP